MKKVLVFVIIGIICLVSITAFGRILEANSMYVEQCPDCLRYYLYPPEYVGVGTWRYTCAYCGSINSVVIEESQDTTLTRFSGESTVNELSCSAMTSTVSAASYPMQ